MAYWAEFTLAGHKVYFVAVLRRDSAIRYSSLSVFHALIAGIELQPAAAYRALGLATVRFKDGREARVRLEPSTSGSSPDVVYIRVPPEFTQTTAFVDNLDVDVGQWPISFVTNEAGEFSAPAQNRLEQAGIYTANMKRHMTSHVQAVPGGGPQHTMHPATSAQQATATSVRTTNRTPQHASQVRHPLDTSSRRSFLDSCPAYPSQ